MLSLNGSISSIATIPNVSQIEIVDVKALAAITTGHSTR
jgi:hypothetical protein